VSSANMLDVMAAGVCGSDIQRVRAGFDVRSLGHELVGRRPGDGALVAIRPLNPCRACPACRRGWTEQCASDTSIGRLDTGQGGFSGRVRAQPGQLYLLPAHLPVAVATLADPLACIVHAFHGMSLGGKAVLIIGGGPMAAIAAVYTGQHAARVSIAVKDATRASRVSDFADHVVTVEDLPVTHYDVVLEAVGGISSAPILTAILAVAPLGQVVALGVYRPDLAAVIPVRTLLEKESTLRGSKAYRVSAERDDFATALEHLATCRDAYSPIITRTPPWSPDDPQPPELERRNGALKTAYVRAPAGPDDTRP
jgi:threonine dehydrogenase-like Zn-dependent dehydrogenase